MDKKNHKHLLIVGAAASGKTTLLNHLKTMPSLQDCIFKDEALADDVYSIGRSKDRHVVAMQYSEYYKLKELHREQMATFAFRFSIISL